MPTPVVMPRQGNNAESSLLATWHKQPGDVVRAGDVLFDVETDKAIFQVESPADGVLLKVLHQAGADVPVQSVVALIGQPGEPDDAIDLAPVASAIAEPAEVPQVPGVLPSPRRDGPGMSPRARGLAQALGVPLAALGGTGPGGRVIERDVRAVAASRPATTRAARDADPLPSVGTGVGGRITTADVAAAPQAAPYAAVHGAALSGVRKLIAERMVRSLQTTAQLTLHMPAEARALLALRARLKASAEGLGLRNISVNDLLLFAVARVLLSHPALNATLEQGYHRQHDAVHLGFAVDTPRGLLVPVVHDAHTLSLRALAQETAHLAMQARDGRVAPGALSGGTFTVTNLGTFGVETFTPILNPPQVAILGVGAVHLKPILVDEQVQHVPHVALSLTIDHQVVDGAPGARFLRALADALAAIDLLLAV